MLKLPAPGTTGTAAVPVPFTAAGEQTRVEKIRTENGAWLEKSGLGAAPTGAHPLAVAEAKRPGFATYEKPNAVAAQGGQMAPVVGLLVGQRPPLPPPAPGGISTEFDAPGRGRAQVRARGYSPALFHHVSLHTIIRENIL